MASAPCLHESSSFDSHGSGGLHDEYSPQLRSGSLNCESSSGILSSASLLANRAAPVYPCDDDEVFSELSSAPSGSSSPPVLCSTQLSERHVFLCFKEPRSWPSVVEGADSDRLPRFLAAAIKSRKNEMMKKTRLIVCEGRDGTDSSNGDVMIFPDMVRYRGLTHFDVDTFVDEVLVRNRDWIPGRPERLLGTHVFVCAHGNREVNYGVLGPEIIERLKQEIAARRLDATLHVKPCSYIGGRKFAKNLIVYSSNGVGEASGHCYGSMTPDNVSDVLDDFCCKGFLAGDCDRQLDWGSREPSTGSSLECSDGSYSNRDGDHQNNEFVVGNVNGQFNVKVDGRQKRLFKVHDYSQQKRRAYSSSMWWQASWWFSFWEKEDTLATLAMVGAAASVFLAYRLCKDHGRC
ncbi:hypothetical protein GOP47_0011264 [Adiantum capillus-veneris]|uniref:Uncharacterized protein n=1 Tax=Adiantum capillus-veneris TaxID=13818 RepID=A0A9D4USL4_ADICA|nr:hypothetical protein GOP47_0011264 [Adiantum capillus-veneris]